MPTAKKETAEVCANCGAPAVLVTTHPGAVPDFYCQACADQVYPDGENLEAV